MNILAGLRDAILMRRAMERSAVALERIADLLQRSWDEEHRPPNPRSAEFGVMDPELVSKRLERMSHGNYELVNDEDNE